MVIEQSAQAAHDRHGAAIHEAGHFVIARHLGIREGKAWIHPSGVDPADVSKRHWGGHFQWRPQRLSPHRMSMIAVAGFIAELGWDDPIPYDIAYYDWGMLLSELLTMSRSDWSGAGIDDTSWTWRTIKACEEVALLIGRDAPLWPEILQVADDLIRFGEINIEAIGGYIQSDGRLRPGITPSADIPKRMKGDASALGLSVRDQKAGNAAFAARSLGPQYHVRRVAADSFRRKLAGSRLSALD